MPETRDPGAAKSRVRVAGNKGLTGEAAAVVWGGWSMELEEGAGGGSGGRGRLESLPSSPHQMYFLQPKVHLVVWSPRDPHEGDISQEGS